MTFDVATISSVLGISALVIGSVVTTWALSKNKSFEGAVKASEVWQSNYEAKEAEVKIEREKNETLAKEITALTKANAELSARVAYLEARPDQTVIITALADISKQLRKESEDAKKMHREFHRKELELLTKLVEKTGKSQEINE